MTVEILHLDGIWRTTLLRDWWAYPGDTEEEKVAWLNQRCWPQAQRDIFRIKPEFDDGPHVGGEG